MTSLVTLTYSAPTRELRRGEVLVTQGEAGIDMYVLEAGRLVVERDGVAIAEIAAPGSLIGEMSVLLQRPHSATVRAERDSRVRVIKDAIRLLESQPSLALKVATLVTERLDATSAMLVKLSQEHGGQPAHEGLFARVFHALNASSPRR